MKQKLQRDWRQFSAKSRSERSIWIVAMRDVYGAYWSQIALACMLSRERVTQLYNRQKVDKILDE